ncbi:MAG: hypothetical protein GY822_11725 [Deltaproteobacteria bacterium]|nr:hypothetical protein [Deltaproteobacteria bacterium]
MNSPMTTRGTRTALFHRLMMSGLFSLGILASGCIGTGGPDPDGGVILPTCTTSFDDAEVLLGQTDLGYIPFEEDNLLRTWERPQGGLGTRINIAMRNVAVDEDFDEDFDAIRIQILRRAEAMNPAPGDEGGACVASPADAGVSDDGGSNDGGIDPLNGAGCKDRLSCVDDVCLLEIINQRSVSFPTNCIDDQLLIVPEWPIRFYGSTGLELGEYEGMKVEVNITVESDVLGELYATENLILEVGEFNPPSWFAVDNEG